jgi:hypothetical protein
MEVFRNEPYNLIKNDKIIARGMAKNIKGFNASFSSTNPSSFSVVMEDPPDAPSKPTKGIDTTYNVLHANWAKISDNS